jgi:hypothetical protein
VLAVAAVPQMMRAARLCRRASRKKVVFSHVWRPTLLATGSSMVQQRVQALSSRPRKKDATPMREVQPPKCRWRQQKPQRAQNVQVRINDAQDMLCVAA